MSALTDQELALIVKLANEQVRLEKEVEEADEILSNKKEELARIQGGWDEGKEVEGALPKAMSAAGVDGIRLTNGMTVSIDDELKPPSMARDSEFREPMLVYLDESGHADAIKDTITIFLNKENYVHAKAITDLISSLKLEFERYRTANWQTLRKLIKDILKEGENIPLAKLNVQQFKKSKIK